MYYFVAAVVLLAFAVIFRIIHSPFGQVLRPSARTSLAPSRSDTRPTSTR